MRFPRPHAKTTGVVLGVALLAFACSRAGLALIDASVGVTVLWPASGFALAAFIMADRHLRPWVLFATFVGVFAAQADARGGIGLAFGLALATSAGTISAALVLHWVTGASRPRLDEVREVVGFFAAVVVGALTSATIGVWALSLAADPPMVQAWGRWVIADALGAMVVAPLFFELRRSHARPNSLLEAVASVATVAVVTVAVFVPTSADLLPVFRWPFLLFPPLFWVAMRGGRRDVVLALAIISVVGGLGTVNGRGLFVREGVDQVSALLAFQVFLTSGIVCLLLLSSITARRRAAEEQLRLSEAHHRAVVANLPGTTVSLYDRDLRCQLLEGDADGSLGEASDASLGQPLEQSLPGDRHRTIRGAIEAALDGEHLSVRHVAASGRHFDVEVTPLETHGAIGHALVVTRDITDRVAAEAATAAVQERFRGAFEHAPVGMAVLDLAGTPVKVNAAFVALLGLDLSVITDTPITSLAHPADAGDLRSGWDWLVAGDLQIWSGEPRLIHAEGHEVRCAAHTTVLRGVDGTPEHFLVHLIDVTERRRFEQQLQHIADHDSLTGLLNRRRFEIDFGEQVGRIEAGGPTGALVLLDVDHFKRVNDTFGHTIGDGVLTAVAAQLRAALRSGDLLARLGGDEFAAWLPGASDSDAERIAGGLVRAMRDGAGEGLPTVTLSVGVAVGTRSSTTGELMRQADLAMYEAKRDGRDGFVVARDRLPSSLSQAIDDSPQAA